MTEWVARRSAARRRGPVGFLLHVGAETVRHRSLLGALAEAATLGKAGMRGIVVEDLGRGVSWRLMRVRRPPRQGLQPRGRP